MSTAVDLNDRQRVYLLAIFETDQAVEADMRSIPYRPFQSRPKASEWRWLEYSEAVPEIGKPASRLYEAIKKTNGATDGEALINAIRGMKWESPRGPVQIDPDTRDIIQNVYMRKVEKTGGELYNVEFATFDAIKDPIKAAAKK